MRATHFSLVFSMLSCVKYLCPLCLKYFLFGDSICISDVIVFELILQTIQVGAAKVLSLLFVLADCSQTYVLGNACFGLDEKQVVLFVEGLELIVLRTLLAYKFV